MKIVSIVGARPQFIKAAPVSKALHKAGHEEMLVHTGQHYDYKMSQIFFDEMDIPEPAINLEVGSGSHGSQTGEMLVRIEKFLLQERPDWVMVYGDTNSTLAGAIAASKLCIPIAHVEAGLRSYNKKMPEEHNRVLTDHCSNLLLCPTETGVTNLAKEGIAKGVRLVGDTMYDAVLQFAKTANERSKILNELKLKPKQYLLVTVHRAYNTDVPENLTSILSALKEMNEPVIFPVHPRTRQKIAELNGRLDFTEASTNVRLIEPVSYLDMLVLEQNARLIMTDSGGMQKEAYFFSVPCATLRPETEWLETVEAGWNVVSGVEPENIIAATQKTDWPVEQGRRLFGNGDAAQKIVDSLENLETACS